MLFRTIFFLFLTVLPCSQAWLAPTQQRFSDWQIICNNQNFCVARNVGLHYGLVVTLSRSVGAVTDVGLCIKLGGTGNPVAVLTPIAPRLLLDGKPVSLTDKRRHIEGKLIKTADSVTTDAFLRQAQGGKTLSLADDLQGISLQGLKAAPFFIDDRRKQVNSETAWVDKGEEPPLSIPPAPALRAAATAETAQSPLGREELNDLIDYGNERMTSSNCSLDPFRREIRVIVLTDDKVLLITSCEPGAYSTVWLAWLVSRQQPYVARQVRLTLPSQPPSEAPREIELIDASYDDHHHELVILDKGREVGDCGIQTRWRFDGQRSSLSRYAQRPTCDNQQGPDAWPTLWIIR